MQRLRGILQVITLLLLFSGQALGEQRGRMTGSPGALLAFSSRESARIAKSVRVPRLTFSRPAMGRITLYFHQRKFKDWDAFLTDAEGRRVPDEFDVALLQGVAHVRRGAQRERVPFGAAVEERRGRKRLIVFLTARRGLARRTVFLRLEAALPRRAGATLNYRVRISPDHVFAGKSCGTETISPRGNFLTAPFTRAATTLREVELVTYADFEFGQLHGPGATAINSEIAAIVNSANVIYEQDLGIRITIRGQYTQSSSSQPFTATHPQTLLNQFSSYVDSSPPSQSRDNAHLFTGKDLDGGTIGIAWVGVVCAAPYFSTGVTQHVSAAANPLTFAHELGHNFDADHDSTTVPRTIMYPSLTLSATGFSAFSQGQIASHVSSYGSCLASINLNGTPTPTPTPTRTPTPGSTPGVTATPTLPATPTVPDSPGPKLPPGIPPGTPGPAPAPVYGFSKVTARLRGNRVVLKVVLRQDGLPAAGHTVELRKGGRAPFAIVSTGTTGAKGNLRQAVRAPGLYRFTFLTPAGMTIESGRIRIRRR